LTSRYQFAASHRLDSPAFTAAENQRVFGKCNNPFGHGHDYILDITVEGPVGPDGLVANRQALDKLVGESVIAKIDHKNLNRDVPGLRGTIPTTENLVEMIRASLESHWTLGARLVRIQIQETARNRFVWEAE
jgi:6-pyruvoyltetrahydropterin/6-carboxytetrahydropterin synthase